MKNKQKRPGLDHLKKIVMKHSNLVWCYLPTYLPTYLPIMAVVRFTIFCLAKMFDVDKIIGNGVAVR